MLDEFRRIDIKWHNAYERLDDVRTAQFDERGRKLVVQVTDDGDIVDLRGVELKLVTVDGLEVGGRNLVLNSGDPLTPRGSGTGGLKLSTTPEGYLQLEAESTNGNYFYFTQLFELRINGQIANNFKRGDYLTFSIDIKSPDSTDIPTLYVYGANDSYQELVGTMGKEFSRFYLTVYYDNDPYPVNLAMGIRGKSGTFIFRHPKVEKGTKATDWTPAPEDLRFPFDLVDPSRGIYELYFPKLFVDNYSGNTKVFLELTTNEFSITSEPFYINVFDGVR